MRTIIIHPTALLREGLRSLLTERGHAVVGDAERVAYAHTLLYQNTVDVVFLGGCDDGAEEVAALRHVRMAASSAKIVVLSSYATHEGIDRALDAGADAYLLRTSSFDDLVSAVERLRTCTHSESPVVAEASDAEPIGANLTPREREVVSLLAGGNRTRDIARRLSISEKTVDSHRQNIKKKLGLDNLASITKFAIREGLSPLIEDPEAVQRNGVAVG